MPRRTYASCFIALFITVVIALPVFAEASTTYIPIVLRAAIPTVAPTATPPGQTPTPALPPPSFGSCFDQPDPASAPNYPIAIVTVNKEAETVTLRNVTAGETISLSGWRMCSITGGQGHPIGGTLAPGQQVTFPGAGSPIWNNFNRDDGALYDPEGRLVSYLID
ncbi:MAG TPA: lamin tail domain-containing protein [Roseiflexaceae bacterium]|nr:lamin tail domain-containing protein [Roseiflexaceae bacterium]